MEDQGHNGKQQQKVYESSGNVKYGKAGDPRNQQDYKQHGPNTHEMPPCRNSAYNARDKEIAIRHTAYSLRAKHLAASGCLDLFCSYGTPEGVP